MNVQLKGSTSIGKIIFYFDRSPKNRGFCGTNILYFDRSTQNWSFSGTFHQIQDQINREPLIRPPIKQTIIPYSKMPSSVPPADYQTAQLELFLLLLSRRP